MFNKAPGEKVSCKYTVLVCSKCLYLVKQTVILMEMYQNELGPPEFESSLF